MRFAGNFLGRSGVPAKIFFEGSFGFVVAATQGRGPMSIWMPNPRCNEGPHLAGFVVFGLVGHDA
jgi:hypothetical protein